MDAWTEFDSGGFRYEIVAERGSEYVRNKVLRTLLKREQEMIAAGDFGRGELTRGELRVRCRDRAGPGERYISIKPKRKDVMLVDGRMVLSRTDDLLRVEGLLAKNPSFWTSQVNVTRHYARVDGVRVPIATESIAKVKFVGQARLNVRLRVRSRSTAAAGQNSRAAPARQQRICNAPLLRDKVGQPDRRPLVHVHRQR